jgi:hypothetical protein
MKPTYPMQVALEALKLADYVELFEGPFGTGVVTQVTDTEVHMMRAYAVTADYSTTGGVGYSVGNEPVTYLKCDTRFNSKSSHTFKVWQRKELR